MKYTHLKTVALMLSASALLVLSGCDGTAGTESNSGLGTVTVITPPVEPVYTAPVAVDDNTTGVAMAATALNVLENDTDAENDIDASTVHFTDASAEDTDVDGDADYLLVPGEGNWAVDVEGNVTFTPEAGFITDPTPIAYNVTDNAGHVSNDANISITIEILASCKAYLDDGLSVGDGNYTIDPDGSGGMDPFEVYCDITSGGYSIKTVTADSPLFAPEAEQYCSDNFGMQLFVPRAESHLTNAVAKYGAEYFYIMGIYPNYDGARCTNTPFNSYSCTTWSPNDNGVWYVSNRTNIAEPNGDNVMNHSMGYIFTGTSILSYNDYPTGYSSANFACSAVDDPLPNARSFANYTPVRINNPGITTSVINVTGATTSISQMTVGLNMSSDNTSSFSITLKSPSGTTIELSNNQTIPMNVIFSDAGPVVPNQPLSTFNSGDANGEWTLEIVSSITVPRSRDRLNSWSLTIE